MKVKNAERTLISFFLALDMYCQLLMMVFSDPMRNAKPTDRKETFSLLTPRGKTVEITNNNQTTITTNIVVRVEGPWYERWGSRSEEVSTPWSYADTDAWALSYPQCGGSRQSPINIQTASLASYPKFNFVNYGNIEGMVAINTGYSATPFTSHTVVVSPPSGFSPENIPYVTGGGLPGQYNFLHFHFHWGMEKSPGSEHLIQSRRYQAELHIVHYNSKYESLTEATKHDDGVAVLGILIERGSRDNLAFQGVVEQLGEVILNGNETTLHNPVSIIDFLPRSTSSYYRYLGSLTTPSCAEIVIWTVFDTPVYISERQLAKFLNLRGSNDELLLNIYRPPQPLNGRPITYRSNSGCYISRGWSLSAVPVIDVYQYCSCVLNFYTTTFLALFGLNFT